MFTRNSNKSTYLKRARTNGLDFQKLCECSKEQDLIRIIENPSQVDHSPNRKTRTDNPAFKEKTVSITDRKNQDFKLRPVADPSTASDRWVTADSASQKTQQKNQQAQSSLQEEELGYDNWTTQDWIWAGPWTGLW